MSSNAKKNIPKLRFPEFSGEWEAKKLGDVTRLFSDRNRAKISGPIYSVTNSKGFVLQTDHFSKSVAGDDLSSYKIVRGGDFAYNPARINVGSIARLHDQIAVISSLYVCFKPLEIIDGEFLDLFLHMDSTRYYYGVYGEGGVRIYLWYPLFSLIKIGLPGKPEQEKISGFLKVVDKRIAATDKKVELLQQYKKGVMQKIFTQQIRFKDQSGQDYPAWQTKKLAEVSEVKGGKRIPKGYSLQAEDNGLPYITVSDFSNGTVNLENIRFVPKNVQQTIKNYTISKDDIYISVAGTLGLIGTVPKQLDGANLTENANKLTNIKISRKYLLHYLNTASFSKLIENTKTDNAQPKLAIYSIKSFEVGIPSDEEQQKIADFLTSLDDKIETEKTKLEQAKLFKKSLLQRMFV